MRLRVPFSSRRLSLIGVGLRGVVVVLGLLAAGCTSRSPLIDPQAPGATDEAAPAGVAVGSIETLHRRKCGNCHTRVEPGAFPRATIEAAMVRHRRRAKLTEGQWAELVEFLAPGSREPRHTARLP